MKLAGRRASQEEGTTCAKATMPGLLNRAQWPGRAELRAESRELQWGPHREGLLRTITRQPGYLSLLFLSRRVLRASNRDGDRTQDLRQGVCKHFLSLSLFPLVIRANHPHSLFSLK